MGAWFGAGEQVVNGPLDFIVLAQEGQQALTQDGVSILGSFTLFDANQHSTGVDVGGFEGNRFGDAEPRAVAGHEHGAVFEDADVVEEFDDLGLAENDGESFGDFQADELGVAPRHFQGHGVEELYGGDEGVDALGGKLALVDQIELVIADVVEA